MRFNTFHTVSRRRTLPRPVSAVRPLYETTPALLDELDVGARWVRLVGMSVSGFTHNAFQLTLDDGWREVALGEAVDKVREKYGFRALTLAGGAPAGATSTTVSRATFGAPLATSTTSGSDRCTCGAPLAASAALGSRRRGRPTPIEHRRRVNERGTEGAPLATCVAASTSGGSTSWGTGSDVEDQQHRSFRGRR